MRELIFHTPWWLPTVLAGIGVFLFWTGNRGREWKVRTAGLALLAAAAVLMALSYIIDTDLEKAVTGSKQLVYSVEKRDWATMKSILDPSVSLSVLGASELYGNRDEMIDAAQRAVDQYGVKNIRILSTDAEQTDTLISVTMTLMSEQDFTRGYPITTSWKFEWQPAGKEWTLVRITCLKIANTSGEQASRQFPRPR
ncbi:MAG: nuclear transport factor 2 family protein [Tepidisphaeraceae bacterium]